MTTTPLADTLGRIVGFLLFGWLILWLAVLRPRARKRARGSVAAGAGYPGPPPGASVAPTASPVSFAGGPGDTRERAVIIQGATGSAVGVQAEYHWLAGQFGPPVGRRPADKAGALRGSGRRRMRDARMT